jgi:tetratricopeptide (TPR) repeat protein
MPRDAPLALAFAMSLSAAALAQGGSSAKPADSAGDPTKGGPTADAKPSPQRSSLDELFARLASAKDEAEANGIANLIERRWSRSGSDTADLLMSRATEAIHKKEYPVAVELLDRVLALEPQWAEAWNRRATAFFLLEDTASAMADLRQVLTREPRHFGAWAGLGHIYMSGGDKKRALDAYKRALAIHPHLGKLKSVVERLEPEIEGRDI